MPLKLPPRLSLAELEAFARSLLTVLLAFLDPRVAGQEARLLQPLPQFDVELDQRPGDAQAQRPGLAGDAAAGDGRQHVELIRGFRPRYRLLDLRAQRLGGECLLDRFAVDDDAPGSGAEKNACGRRLAATGAVVLDSCCCHVYATSRLLLGFERGRGFCAWCGCSASA